VTEGEWLNSADLTPMLRFVDGLADERKLRLLACGCCRRVWGLFTDERSRRAVEVAERYADGEAGPRELALARNQALMAAGGAGRQLSWAAYWTANTKASGPIRNVCAACAAAPARAAAVAAGAVEAGSAWNDALTAGAREQTAILRDLVGNPFRPVRIRESWLTPAVLAVARYVYDARDFDSLPVLGDALEEAGCTAQELLDHCRQPGEHVRGCWAVDLCLNRA
jgi:hypothetical protein